MPHNHPTQHTEVYVTTQQQRECLALRSLRKPPTYKDIRPDSIVDVSWFSNGGADWDEDSLTKVLWWDHMYRQDREAQS